MRSALFWPKALLLLQFGFLQTIAQFPSGIQESRFLRPPTKPYLNTHAALLKGGETFYPIAWAPPLNSHNFTVRLYLNETNVLLRTIHNKYFPTHNFTNLVVGEHYRTTVSTIGRDQSGNLYESAESPSYIFYMKEACGNGSIWNPCLAHCPATCEDPTPVCDRSCTPGCVCLPPAGILNHGICIPQVICPSPLAIFRPKNINVSPAPDNTDSVWLNWDPVPNASSYLVLVKLNSNRSVEVTRTRVPTPFAIINNLVPGTEYLFKVEATVNIMQDGPTGRSSMLPPRNITIFQLGETSLSLSWSHVPGAKRYGLKVYAESTRDTLLYSNERVPVTTADITGLLPGMVYYVTIQASRNADEALGPPNGVGALTRGVRNPNELVDGPTAVFSLLTLCQQRRQSINLYNQGVEPSLRRAVPNCQPDGTFQTRYCDDNRTLCYCVEPETGIRRPGTEHGSAVRNNFPLDCQQYETYTYSPSNVTVTAVKSTRATLTWIRAMHSFGYIVIVSTANQMDLVHHVQTSSTSFTNLNPGTEYQISVRAVGDSGVTSPAATTTFHTSYVDPPKNLHITRSSASSLIASWDVGASAISFNVDLVNQRGSVIRMLNEIVQNTVSFNNLSTGQMYSVRVRAVSRIIQNGVEAIHTSEAVQMSTVLLCSLRPIDVIFVYEVSNHLTAKELKIVQQVFSDILIGLPPVSIPEGTRVAAVKYLPWVRTIFSYNRFNNTAGAVNAIKYTKWYGSLPNTAHMLRYVHAKYFSSTAGSEFAKRPNALSAVILFSGGRSSTSITTSARNLRQATNVISVGVNGRSDDRELTLLASRPSLKMVAPSYDTLSSLKERILEAICAMLTA
ncbi:collagen alpha-1(XII) chain [Ciona intestinalis]